MKKFLKQLFCSHIMAAEKEEDLAIIERSISCYLSSYVISRWLEYAVHERCVKCGKKRIKVYRKAMKNES